jgi:hypothetical protein
MADQGMQCSGRTLLPPPETKITKRIDRQLEWNCSVHVRLASLNEQLLRLRRLLPYHCAVYADTTQGSRDPVVIRAGDLLHLGHNVEAGEMRTEGCVVTNSVALGKHVMLMTAPVPK